MLIFKSGAVFIPWRNGRTASGRLKWGLLAVILLLASGGLAAEAPKVTSAEDLLITAGVPGRRGGRLVVSLRSEPKTLNPVTALDLLSKKVIALLSADLIHINLQTQQTGPALSKSWKVSSDGKRYVLELRRGISFSDGHPFDADDVVFSFRVYLDEAVHSPQRDLLEVEGKPIQIHKTGPYEVVFDFPGPYAAAERMFDSVNILPRHLLENAYAQGEISQAWNLAVNPNEIAGLGPFRLKRYVAGERIVLERNPFYWKADQEKTRLPYLDEIVFLIVPSEDAEAARFQMGDLDVLDKISAEDYTALEREQRARGYRLYDLGPGLEYDFLFFNLNDLGSRHPEISRKQQWFRRSEFRQAVSAAVDRAAIVRLAFQGRATAIWGQVTPGNRVWVDPDIPHPPQSREKAEDLLRSAGFSHRADGSLVDPQGVPVEFSVLVNPANPQLTKTAAIIQEDLARLGMKVHIAAMESRAQLSRIFDSFDYDAALLGLVSGDTDPDPEINVWTSGGGTHLWAMTELHPATAWQAELDRLMHLQTSVLDYRKRKQLYDRVQQLVAQYVPVICLVSPNVLVGVKTSVGGTQPSVMRHHLLWNAEQLFWLRDHQ